MPLERVICCFPFFCCWELNPDTEKPSFLRRFFRKRNRREESLQGKPLPRPPADPTSPQEVLASSPEFRPETNDFRTREPYSTHPRDVSLFSEVSPELMRQRAEATRGQEANALGPSPVLTFKSSPQTVVYTGHNEFTDTNNFDTDRFDEYAPGRLRKMRNLPVERPSSEPLYDSQGFLLAPRIGGDASSRSSDPGRGNNQFAGRGFTPTSTLDQPSLPRHSRSHSQRSFNLDRLRLGSHARSASLPLFTIPESPVSDHFHINPSDSISNTIANTLRIPPPHPAQGEARSSLPPTYTRAQSTSTIPAFAISPRSEPLPIHNPRHRSCRSISPSTSVYTQVAPYNPFQIHWSPHAPERPQASPGHLQHIRSNFRDSERDEWIKRVGSTSDNDGVYRDPLRGSQQVGYQWSREQDGWRRHYEQEQEQEAARRRTPIGSTPGQHIEETFRRDSRSQKQERPITCEDGYESARQAWAPTTHQCLESTRGTDDEDGDLVDERQSEAGPLRLRLEHIHASIGRAQEQQSQAGRVAETGTEREDIEYLSQRKFGDVGEETF